MLPRAFDLYQGGGSLATSGVDAGFRAELSPFFLLGCLLFSPFLLSVSDMAPEEIKEEVCEWKSIFSRQPFAAFSAINTSADPGFARPYCLMSMAPSPFFSLIVQT